MAVLQNDPNVKIPAAVRRAADLAERTHQQMFGGGDPSGDNPNAPTAPSAVEGGVTPEGNGQSAASAEPVVPPIPGPTLEPVSEPPKEPSKETPKEPSKEPPKEPSKAVNWEHRYNSMKGRHDALQSRVTEMASEIQSLQGLVASLRAAASESASAAVTQERLITPDEESEYGSELLSVVGKKAREEFLPEIRKIAQKLEGIERRVEGVNEHVSVDARARMHEVLDRELPDWRQINYNENFLTWLQLPDIYSGVIRQELLNAAYERNSAPQVLAFFKGFIADEAASAPDVAEPDPAPSAPPKVPLEQFAAPGRAKTAAATPPAGKPTFTRASIASFYADVSAGKYRGREADKDRIERQIFEAQQDGRILG